MKFTRKQVLITITTLAGVGLIAAVGFFAVIAYVFSGELHTESDKASAMKCTLEWGRLAAFPASAQEVKLTTTGNMFTRGFRASFIAPPAVIEQWLQESPGTREAVPTFPSPGTRHFQIVPGGGAQGAEVTVDDTEHRVAIRVYWS